MTKDSDNQDVTVHWVSGTPIADLKPAVGKLLPPGEWVSCVEFQKLLGKSADHLKMLSGNSMKGRVFVALSRDIERIALVEEPHPQIALNLNESNSAANIEDDTVAQDSTDYTEYSSEPDSTVKVTGTVAGAIDVAVELLRDNDAGKYVSAEEFLDKVATSPDTRMTSGALKAAGSGEPAHGAEVSFDPNIFGRFPKHLESTTEYRMLLSDFADVCPSSLKAGFQRLHESGVTNENRVGKLLHTRKRLPVYLSGSADGLLFRVAASAGLELDAFVTVTISTDERQIIGYTLARLTDPERTLQQLEDMLRNQVGREPLTANLV